MFAEPDSLMKIFKLIWTLMLIIYIVSILHYLDSIYRNAFNLNIFSHRLNKNWQNVFSLHDTVVISQPQLGVHMLTSIPLYSRHNERIDIM